MAVMYTGLDVMHFFVYFGSFALVVNKLYVSIHISDVHKEVGSFKN